MMQPGFVQVMGWQTNVQVVVYTIQYCIWFERTPNLYCWQLALSFPIQENGLLSLGPPKFGWQHFKDCWQHAREWQNTGEVVGSGQFGDSDTVFLWSRIHQRRLRDIQWQAFIVDQGQEVSTTSTKLAHLSDLQNCLNEEQAGTCEGRAAQRLFLLHHSQLSSQRKVCESRSPEKTRIARFGASWKKGWKRPKRRCKSAWDYWTRSREQTGVSSQGIETHCFNYCFGLSEVELCCKMPQQNMPVSSSLHERFATKETLG